MRTLLMGHLEVVGVNLRDPAWRLHKAAEGESGTGSCQDHSDKQMSCGYLFF